MESIQVLNVSYIFTVQKNASNIKCTVSSVQNRTMIYLPSVHSALKTKWQTRNLCNRVLKLTASPCTHPNHWCQWSVAHRAQGLSRSGFFFPIRATYRKGCWFCKFSITNFVLAFFFRAPKFIMHFPSSFERIYCTKTRYENLLGVKSQVSCLHSLGFDLCHL